MSSADRNRLHRVVSVVATLGLIVVGGVLLTPTSRAQQAVSGKTVVAPYPQLPPMPGVVPPQVTIPSNMVMPPAGGASETQAAGSEPEPLSASSSPAAVVASALPAVTEGEESLVTAPAFSVAASEKSPAETAPPPQEDVASDAPPPSTEEILRRLRQSDAPPLTISQMAALNDAIKRAEYLGQIEQKMQEMNLGVVSGSRAAALPPPVSPGRDFPLSPRGSSAGEEEQPRVLRVVGARGRYAALLLVDGAQVLAQPGDVVGSVRVASVGLSGVRATTRAGNLVTLSFVSPTGVDGVSVASGRH